MFEKEIQNTKLALFPRFVDDIRMFFSQFLIDETFVGDFKLVEINMFSDFPGKVFPKKAPGQAFFPERQLERLVMGVVHRFFNVAFG